MRECPAGRAGRSRTRRRPSTRGAIPTNPSPRPLLSTPAGSPDGTYTVRELVAGSRIRRHLARRKVFASMADSTPRPADVPVDRLSVVREWFWRHSSQPNGDPWDGDPEHLDRAAQHLLDELVLAHLGEHVVGKLDQVEGVHADCRVGH